MYRYNGTEIFIIKLICMHISANPDFFLVTSGLLGIHSRHIFPIKSDWKISVLKKTLM